MIYRRLKRSHWELILVSIFESVLEQILWNTPPFVRHSYYDGASPFTSHTGNGIQKTYAGAFHTACGIIHKLYYSHVPPNHCVDFSMTSFTGCQEFEQLIRSFVDELMSPERTEVLLPLPRVKPIVDLFIDNHLLHFLREE